MWKKEKTPATSSSLTRLKHLVSVELWMQRIFENSLYTQLGYFMDFLKNFELIESNYYILFNLLNFISFNFLHLLFNTGWL